MRDRIEFYKNRVHFLVLLFILRAKDIPAKIKRIIWNRGILLWWYRLWIRRDEFHQSLSIDIWAIWDMNDGKLDYYIRDIVKRRDKACKMC